MMIDHLKPYYLRLISFWLPVFVSLTTPATSMSGPCNDLLGKKLDPKSNSFSRDFWARVKAQEAVASTERSGGDFDASVDAFWARVRAQETAANAATSGADRFKVRLPQTFFQRFKHIFGETPFINILIKDNHLSDPQKTILSRVLFNLYERKERVPVDNDEIVIMPPLKQLFRVEPNGQIIHPWSRLDREVVSFSNVDTEPREVAGFVAFDRSGHILAKSSLIAGRLNFIYAHELDRLWDDLLDKLKASGHYNELGIVELSHSHPTYDAGFTAGPNYWKYALYGPLSNADLVWSEEHAHYVPKGVLFKFSAAKPNGYTYSVFYGDSEEAQDSVASHFSELAPKFGIENPLFDKKAKRGSSALH
jgi:hypothetical protein